MIFTISRAKPIDWPNKCVWCRKESTASYTISGIGIVGNEEILAEWNKLEIAKLSYPVCQKHWWCSLGMQTTYLVSFLGILFSWIIHPILPFISAGIFLLAARLRPVKIRGVTRHFYKVVIRKDDYAEELALFNDLNQFREEVASMDEVIYRRLHLFFLSL